MLRFVVTRTRFEDTRDFRSTKKRDKEYTEPCDCSRLALMSYLHRKRAQDCKIDSLLDARGLYADTCAYELTVLCSSKTSEDV